MKTDINDYKIRNHDGVDKTVSNEGKQSFANDDIRSIKENSTASVRENVRVGETFDDRSKKYSDGSSGNSAKNSSKSGNGDTSSSSSSSSSSVTSSATSSVSSAASSAATSAASAIGGSMGAIAGSVAASVMTAVMVVAVFVSTLTINLSLVMASMTGLVFQVELSGAQEEDFANPIVAVLEDDTGVCGELEIFPDTLYLTFEDLQPGKEYVITVKNDEKVFFKKSFLTATEQIEKGSVYVSCEETRVFVSVEDVVLKAGEYYTVTVKDAKGNVLFAKDGTDVSAEYKFDLSEPQSVFVSLSVGAKTYSVSQFIVEKRDENKPEYDYDNPAWTWSENLTWAKVTFAELNGGNALEYDAKVDVKSEKEKTCYEDGYIEYVAIVETDGREFTDSKTVTIPAGHEYVYVEEIAITEEGSGVRAHYECSDCGELFDLDYNDVEEKDLLIVPEYDYDDPVWAWSENYSVATLSFEETHGLSQLSYQVKTRKEEKEKTCDEDGCIKYVAIFEIDGREFTDTKTVTIPAGHEYVYIDAVEPDCENDGHTAYYQCEICGGYFDGDENEVSEEDIIVFSLGHSYGKPVFEWTESGDGYTATATFVCERDESHVEILDAQVYKETGGYSAIVEFEEHIYEDFMPIETSGEAVLSLNEGWIIIDPTGYARSGDASSGKLDDEQTFESSENSPYLITGSIYSDESLDVWNFSGKKAVVYMTLDNVIIESGMWATAFRIVATNDIDIYINVLGSASITAGNHPAIELQAKSSDVHVNVYVTCDGGFDEFVCSRQYGNTPKVFKAEGDNASISFYMNGVEVDCDGKYL